MIAWLLSWLPAWVTGRAGPMAKREVSGWTKGNTTLRILRYGLFRRFLLWGSDRPALFALVVGVVSASVAFLSTNAAVPYVPHLPELNLDAKFDAAAFAGVPWSVQATLVALVYPIVLSFIALMLQRRAHSTVALRVYVLDSAVAPAGVSSIALVLAMGLQYFATPYSTPEFLKAFMPALLVMNGTWLAANLCLTGLFLVRTVRFIQEEEQQYAYTRVAVDVALRSELTTAVKQSIVVGAPQQRWGFPEEAAVDGDAHPRVRMFLIGRSVSSRQEVHRELKGSLVLHDVHLNLLRIAVRSWQSRAQKTLSADKRREPVLSFPPMVGEIATGRVVLCVVEDGPPLTPFEGAIIRGAFWFRPSRRETLSLSTRRMLEEIGGEIETASEQRRFSAANDSLRSVVKLHKTLLLASAGSDKSDGTSAATMHTSPYGWGNTSFDLEWLKPYREIGRIATNLIDEDARLFRTLAVVPASLAAALSPRPEQLVINAMLVGMNVAYHLGRWWTRKADAHVEPSKKSFSGILPPVENKPYEQALIAFVGSWGQLHIRQHESRTQEVADVWASLTASAHVYAQHIENSAEMFLKAVSRGDEVAAGWFLDGFLKWWGNRQFEMEHADPDEFPVRYVTLSLANKSWNETRELLSEGAAPVSIKAAGRALNLTVRRYWESMRLYLVVLLVHNAGSTPAADKLELRLASALIQGTPQHRGGAVDCWPLDNVDALMRALLDAGFGVESMAGRIDAFAERLRWDDEAPEVSGWVYSWSGTPTSLDSMVTAQVTLLVAMASPRLPLWTHRQPLSRYNPLAQTSRRLIESWWKDLDKLESVGRYCDQLKTQVLSEECRQAAPAISILRRHLSKTTGVRPARVAVARAISSLSEVAAHERTVTLRALKVDERLVQRFAEEASQHAFGPRSWPHRVGVTLEFTPDLVGASRSVRIDVYKKDFVDRQQSQSDSGLAEYVGEHLREAALAWCLRDFVSRFGVTPVNGPGLRDNYQASQAELQTFITAVGHRCAQVRAAGENPVVLVGRTAVGSYLSARRWGANPWQCPLPGGITWRRGELANDEPDAELLNDAPVYEFDTPEGDCYVVPYVAIQTLEVRGNGPASSASIKWTQLNDERLQLVVSCVAVFRQAD